MTIEDLRDPNFRVAELSNEDFVIYQVASEALDSGNLDFACQVVQREADRDPKVHLRLFFSNAWPQPELPAGLWDEVVAGMGLS